MHAVTVKRFEKVRSVSFPNPMTLKVTDFPDAVWQEGSPGPDEENKKSSSKSDAPFSSYSNASN